MTIAYKSPLSLVRAERYSDPGEPSAILPDVYGDLTVGGIRGPIPVPLIDAGTNTYGTATPMTSVTAVYEEEADVTADATITLSTDYQSQGLITTIAFATPRSGQITIRGIGKVVDANNPISQLEDLLAARAGAVAGDYVVAALERARQAADDAGFALAWVIADDRSAESWIAEFMLNVFGGWVRIGNGRLALWLEGDAWSPSDIAVNIVAHRDCVDGDDGPSMQHSEEDLCTQLVVYYKYSWSLGQPSSRLTRGEDGALRDASGYNAYGAVEKSVTLRGHRDASQIPTWAERFFAIAASRTRVEGSIVTIPVDGARAAHVTEGARIGFSWRYGPERERGNPYRNEVLRVLGCGHDLGGAPGSMLTALSVGRYISESAYYDRSLYFDASEYFGAGRELAELP